VGSHPKLFLHFRLDLKLLWPGKSIKQQASSLFLDYYKKGSTKRTLCGIVLSKLNTFFSHVFADP
jgi:hypothetical protein